MVRSLLPFILAAFLAACSDHTPPCVRFFEPYPDLNPARAHTARNVKLVEAMELYRRNDLSAAATTLEGYLANDPEEESTGHFYLANCYLALGRPYDAERELDRVESDRLRPFQDEVEWYNTLCLVCSDQHDRALALARAIAAQPQHAYKAQADALVNALER